MTIRSLRIGIDARAAAEVPAGRGRVLRELLQALDRRGDDHRYLLYARERWTGPLSERFSWRRIALPDPWWNIRAALATGDIDVFVSTNSYLTAWFVRVPCAVVVYDLVAFQQGARAQQRAARIERTTFGLGVRRASSLVCISEATRRDLVQRFPAAAAKSSVVYLAANQLFARALPEDEIRAVRERLALTEPFVLSVGTLEPRKNLVRVVEAFSRLPETTRTSHRLAIVGPTGWEADEILRVAGERERVHLLGFVRDEDLAALYQACAVFCYPSLYEGFGLPLLEAMTAGAACITSNVSSLPEVGGDGALYADPRSVPELSAALARLLAHPEERQALGERARRQATQFSWDRTADELLAVLTPLAARR